MERQPENDPGRIRTHNLLIWSQMRYRCATEPDGFPSTTARKPIGEKKCAKQVMTLAGLEPAIFGSEDRRLIH